MVEEPREVMQVHGVEADHEGLAGRRGSDLRVAELDGPGERAGHGLAIGGHAKRQRLLRSQFLAGALVRKGPKPPEDPIPDKPIVDPTHAVDAPPDEPDALADWPIV